MSVFRLNNIVAFLLPNLSLHTIKVRPCSNILAIKTSNGQLPLVNDANSTTFSCSHHSFTLQHMWMVRQWCSRIYTYRKTGYRGQGTKMKMHTTVAPLHGDVKVMVPWGNMNQAGRMKKTLGRQRNDPMSNWPVTTQIKMLRGEYKSLFSQ